MAGNDVDPLSEGALYLPLAWYVFDRSHRIHRPREGFSVSYTRVMRMYRYIYPRNMHVYRYIYVYQWYQPNMKIYPCIYRPWCINLTSTQRFYQVFFLDFMISGINNRIILANKFIEFILCFFLLPFPAFVRFYISSCFFYMRNSWNSVFNYVCFDYFLSYKSWYGDSSAVDATK